MNSYLTSSEESGTTTLPRNDNRIYFSVYATSGTLTVKFGGGAGAITVAQGGFLEPLVVPTSEIEIVGTTYTVTEGGD